MGGLGNLTRYIQDNVIVLAVLIVGALILFRAHGGNHGRALVSVAIVLIGFAVIGLATPGTPEAVGSFLVGLVGL